MVFFGADYPVVDVTTFFVRIEVLAGAFFLIIALAAEVEGLSLRGRSRYPVTPGKENHMRLCRCLVGGLLFVLGLRGISLAGEVKSHTIDLGLVRAEVTVPAQWVRLRETPFGREPVFADTLGNGARISLTGTPMTLRSKTAARMHSRALDEAIRRLSRKDYVFAEELTIDHIPGVVAIDTSCFPYRHEMTWIGHGPTGVLSFVLYAEPQFFEAYRPIFREILESIRFVEEDGL